MLYEFIFLKYEMVHIFENCDWKCAKLTKRKILDVQNVPSGCPSLTHQSHKGPLAIIIMQNPGHYPNDCRMFCYE